MMRWSLVGLLCLVVFRGTAGAQGSGDELAELRARLERLEKQNEELLRALKTRTPSPLDGGGKLPDFPRESVAKEEVQKIVADYLQSKEEAKAAEPEAGVLGQVLGMKARWEHGIWLETPDKALRIHAGGRTQFDIVGVTAPDNVMFGRGGIGAFDDAVNFRRGRFDFEGTIWRVIDFKMEWDFINTFDVDPSVPHTSSPATVGNTPVPTDLWMQISKIPVVGNLRVGNQKPWISFEHMTSSRFLNFLERSYGFDAFIEEGNNGFSPGVSLWRNFGEDDRFWYGLGLIKTTRSIFAWNVGDGEWGTVGRLAWLPWWEEDGRRLIHVALGGSFKDLDDDQARFRARTMLRNGPAALHNIAAIAQVRGDNQMLVNPEFVFQCGPFMLQSEYMGAWVNGADRIVRTPLGNLNQDIAARSYFAQGGYLELWYFLTGEHRRYSKKVMSFERVIPHRNYGEGSEDGCSIFGGAWQVGARYSHLDLNDAGINGGRVDSVTGGLNWFLNPNFKIQWNYEYGYRSIPGGTASGPFQEAGVRFALDW